MWNIHREKDKIVLEKLTVTWRLFVLRTQTGCQSNIHWRDFFQI